MEASTIPFARSQDSSSHEIIFAKNQTATKTYQYSLAAFWFFGCTTLTYGGLSIGLTAANNKEDGHNLFIGALINGGIAFVSGTTTLIAHCLKKQYQKQLDNISQLASLP